MSEHPIILCFMWLHPFINLRVLQARLDGPKQNISSVAAQPQHTRWNLFTCHCNSTSEVSQTSCEPCHNTSAPHHKTSTQNHRYEELLVFSSRQPEDYRRRRGTDPHRRWRHTCDLSFGNWRKESGRMQHPLVTGRRFAIAHHVISDQPRFRRSRRHPEDRLLLHLFCRYAAGRS